MAEITIGQARNNFSSLIANILSGVASDYVIKNRNTPVARIVPITAGQATRRTFGIAKDDPFVLDDAVFDELDAEIAEDFGM